VRRGSPRAPRPQVLGQEALTRGAIAGPGARAGEGELDTGSERRETGAEAGEEEEGEEKAEDDDGGGDGAGDGRDFLFRAVTIPQHGMRCESSRQREQQIERLGGGERTYIALPEFVAFSELDPVASSPAGLDASSSSSAAPSFLPSSSSFDPSSSSSSSFASDSSTFTSSAFSSSDSVFGEGAMCRLRGHCEKASVSWLVWPTSRRIYKSI
jgi:hypothetical protein